MLEDRLDVVVVGAGLAGLTAAAVAARNGRSVVVLDGRRPGGRAATDVRNGFRFNQGAHALYRDGAGRAVLGRLGIVPTGGKPPTRGVMGWRDGSARAFPGDPVSLMRSPLLGASVEGEGRDGARGSPARRRRPPMPTSAPPGGSIRSGYIRTPPRCSRRWCTSPASRTTSPTSPPTP